MARRMVFLNDKRWNNRVFDWHPGLDTSIRTGRQIGRPKRRWEDDLNDFLKMEGSHVESTSLVTENHNKNGYVKYTTITRTTTRPKRTTIMTPSTPTRMTRTITTRAICTSEHSSALFSRVSCLNVES